MSRPRAPEPTLAPAGDPPWVASVSTFVRAAGLLVDESGPTRVRGHIILSSEHHTPWGIVHGGVYASAVESAASIGATIAVLDRGLVAVGLTNTTHFLRAMTEGRVEVEAVALYQGRTHQLWRVSITDPSDRLVAHGELRVQNVPAERGADGSARGEATMTGSGPDATGGPA